MTQAISSKNTTTSLPQNSITIERISNGKVERIAGSWYLDAVTILGATNKQNPFYKRICQCAHSIKELQLVVSKRNLCYAAMHEGKPIGLIAANHFDTNIWVEILISHPKRFTHEGIKGAGTALIEKILQIGKTLGATECNLVTVDSAREFYKAMEFEPFPPSNPKSSKLQRSLANVVPIAHISEDPDSNGYPKNTPFHLIEDGIDTAYNNLLKRGADEETLETLQEEVYAANHTYQLVGYTTNEQIEALFLLDVSDPHSIKLEAYVDTTPGKMATRETKIYLEIYASECNRKLDANFPVPSTSKRKKASSIGGSTKDPRLGPRVMRATARQVARIAASWFPKIGNIRKTMAPTHSLYKKVSDGCFVIRYAQNQSYQQGACFIAKGQQDAPLGFMTIDADSELNRIKITELCASPDRILGRGEKGGASALLSYAQELAERLNYKGVYLESTYTAEPFYIARGYVQKEDYLSIDVPTRAGIEAGAIPPFPESYIPEELSIINRWDLDVVLPDETMKYAEKKTQLEQDLRSPSHTSQLAGICDASGKFYALASIDVSHPECMKVLTQVNLTPDQTGSFKLLQQLSDYADQCGRELTGDL